MLSKPAFSKATLTNPARGCPGCQRSTSRRTIHSSSHGLTGVSSGTTARAVTVAVSSETIHAASSTCPDTTLGRLLIGPIPTRLITKYGRSAIGHHAASHRRRPVLLPRRLGTSHR